MSGNADGLAAIVGQIKTKLAAIDHTKGKLEAALKLLTDDKVGGATRPGASKRGRGAGNGVAASSEPPRPPAM